MPTASTIEGSAVFNLGPLTTSWTAPASCATEGFNTVLAVTVPEDEGPYIMSVVECRATAWDGMDECFPNGKKFMSLITSLEEKAEPTYGAHFYHSPGLQCPEGWYTAGAATMNGDGDVEKTGAIFDIPATQSVDDVLYKPFHQQFADALDAGETGIWCCPSGYSIDHYGDSCFSTLNAEDVTITGMCTDQILNTPVESTHTFTFEGTVLTRTNEYPFGGERTASSEVQETTILPSELEVADLTPVVYYPLMTMAHKEGDSDRGSGGDEEGEGNGDGDNAASGLMGAGVTALVVGAAGVLGAALVL